MAVAPDAICREDMTKPRVFILDDDRQVGDIVSRMLESNGFVPHQFSDANVFFDETKSAPPWAIILEVALGQCDAIEIFRQLQNLKYRGKVLLISSRDESTLQAVHKIGASNGLAMLPPLHKPFRSNDLKKSLAAAPESRSTTMDEEIDEKPAIHLEQALAEDWLELWYHPKVDLKTFTVCGAEALLRARHPELGVLLPGAFLPPAGNPLYYPLSRYVIKTVMADWARHFAQLPMPFKLAVNFPVSVVAADGFVHFLREALPKNSNFSGLVIEVAESELIRDIALVREVAERLKLYNVLVSIDDFGRAYSSLARLRDLPIAELKLDRAYTTNCSSNSSNRTLCQSVVRLAHRFGATVCAEGVANTQDLRALIEMKCDTAQGNLFAKPNPVEIFTASLHAPPTQTETDAILENPVPQNDPHAGHQQI
jgi:EAL domain-containing protein (putative c-di-GMP-specific phosphodiesterase class I)/ActR/RegA family two-component response regulator